MGQARGCPVPGHTRRGGGSTPRPGALPAAGGGRACWGQGGFRPARGDSMESGLISHPDKVLFPERGETKGDLAGYYLGVAEPLMRAMGGRPVLLQRFPEGAAGPSFFQKRVPKNAPGWLQTTTVATPNGTTSQALVAADIDHVLWAVNLGCLGFHVWPYLADDPEHSDELRIDLDPSPGVNCLPNFTSPATQRPPATGACTCISGFSRTGTPTRSARVPWPWPANWSG